LLGSGQHWGYKHEITEVTMKTFSCLVLSLVLGGCKNEGADSDSTPVDTGESGADSGDGLMRFTVLHTNDWHSHLLGRGPNAEYTPGTTGDDGTIGGVARMRTLADEIRSSSTDPVLLFDSGDWIAGDVFQLLETSHAPELQIMDMMGYDAVTLGNHEFDWGPAFLGDMIAVADSLGVTVPIVASNTLPAAADAADDPLEALFDSGRIESTQMIVLDNGLTIGLFGLLGEEAASTAPAAAPTTFGPTAATAAEMVDTLRGQGADVVILLSHIGVTDDPDTSPEVALAQEVPGIDVIVGGHSHTVLSEPIVVGSTVIVQAGENAEFLGQLDLAWDGATVSVEDYTLHTLDDTILGDSQVTDRIDGFVTALDKGPLVDLGYSFYQPIMSAAHDVPQIDCVETGLGHNVTDGYVYSMNALNPEHPIDFAFESHGVIRDGISAGSTGVQDFCDVFRTLPLGFGTDDVPGYALVDFWVTAAELEGVCEVTASISPLFGCDYFIEMSSRLRCTEDSVAVPFTRVQSMEAWDGEAWQELDTSESNTTLYHVAVDSYVASLMGVLDSLTSGLITITPKDAAGVPLADPGASTFDADPETPEVEELKLWQALLRYDASFEDGDGDGIPDLPATYLEPTPRIVGYE
jgi:5'-nucleotidase / UDP-sugar diphosphatase